jgi:hypothetical protein
MVDIPINALGSSITQMALLSDGRVLVVGDPAVLMLTPDRYGKYCNGTWTRVSNVPKTAIYGPNSLSPDGTLLQHYGEFGSSVYGSSIFTNCVFHPGSNQWVEYGTSNPNLKFVAQHSNAFITDDGVTVGRGGEMKKNGTPNDIVASRWSDISNFSQFETEAAFAKIPNGNAVCFSFDGVSVRLISPGYNSTLQSAGSSSTTVGVTTVDCTSRLQTLHASRPMSRSSLKWTTPPFSANVGVGYEQGATIYMPKIDRVVLIGGNGYIYTITTDLNPTNLNLAAALPMEPRYPDPRLVSTYLGTFVNPLGEPTIPNGNNCVVACGPVPPGYSSWQQFVQQYNIDTQHQGYFIRATGYASGDTGWVRCVSSSVSYNASTNRLTFTGGGSIGTDGGFVQEPSYAKTGDQVTWERPSYQGMDAPATILPNGDLLFAASGVIRYTNNDFDNIGVWFTWDGSSASPNFLFNDEKTVMPTASYYCGCFPLPSGEIFLGHAVYTPTSTQATPITGSRPIITSVPATIYSGLTFTLGGNQLNGLHEGGQFGDDKCHRTNFPIISLTNPTTQEVYYCRSTDWSYYGIQPNRPSTVKVMVPAHIPEGSYQLRVIASGVGSDPSTVTVLALRTTLLMIG